MLNLQKEVKGFYKEIKELKPTNELLRKQKVLLLSANKHNKDFLHSMGSYFYGSSPSNVMKFHLKSLLSKSGLVISLMK